MQANIVVIVLIITLLTIIIGVGEEEADDFQVVLYVILEVVISGIKKLRMDLSILLVDVINK